MQYLRDEIGDGFDVTVIVLEMDLVTRVQIQYKVVCVKKRMNSTIAPVAKSKIVEQCFLTSARQPV